MPTHSTRDRYRPGAILLLPALLVTLGTSLLAQPVIQTNSPLFPGDVNVAYSQGMSATGGTQPYTWQVSAGQLPTGLSMDSGTGTISGTPTVVNTFNFTVEVIDSTGLNGTKAFALTINPPPNITTASPLQGADNGVAYSKGVRVNGGTANYFWNVSGNFPPGMFLDPNTCGRGGARPKPGVTPNDTSVCLVTGTPTATGSYAFTLSVDDNYGLATSKAFTLTVNALPSLANNPPLPNATQNVNYSHGLTVTGGTAPFVWTVVAGAGNLPTGITLNSATGLLSGPPTVTGTFNFTVQVTDSYSQNASNQFSLTVTAPLQITSSSPLPSGTIGANYSQTLMASGGTPPYGWNQTTGNLPAGLNLNSANGVISGPPNTVGTSNFTIQVSDNLGATSSKVFVVTINAAPSITTLSLPGATVNTNYTQTIAAVGGTAPLTWSISAGALPLGLNLNPSNGQITGAPTTAGTSNFTARVVDANGVAATQALSIIVNPALTFFTTSPLPSATVGAPYPYNIAVSGGTQPYTWQVSGGSLPAGLTLNSGNGNFAGSPTTAGNSNFTVLVTDANQATASMNFNLVVNPAPVITTQSPLPSGTVGGNYSATLTVSGGTPSFLWFVSQGLLPNGLQLDSASCGQPEDKGKGALSRMRPLLKGSLKGSKVRPHEIPPNVCFIGGVPQTAGTYQFTMTVVDSNNATANQAYTLVVNPAPTITTTVLADGTVGVNYSQTLNVANGTAPFTWSITQGNLPNGLTLNSATGQISGVATTAGLSNFIANVTDTNGVSAAQPLSLNINSTLSITTTSPLPPATANTQYFDALSVSGGTAPFLWVVSVGSLPAGLSLDSGSGQITGTPTTAGTSNFTVQVTDTNQASASAPFALTVNAAPAISTTSPLPGATQGFPYSKPVMVTGGTTPFFWQISAGSLPNGLSLDSATCGVGDKAARRAHVRVSPKGLIQNPGTTCLITGTPTTLGTSSFSLQAIDFNGASATQAFTLTVNPTPQISTNALALGVVGTPYNQTLAETGGSSPFVWTVSAGNLPGGLALNSATGQITGTPTTVGVSSFTITLTDSEGAANSKPLTITVVGSLVITTSSPLSTATVGILYSQLLSAVGGTMPFTWSLLPGSTLPGGLSLNSATGVISGIPTAAGSANFTIQVTDKNQLIASKLFNLTIDASLAITTTQLPNGTIGVAYSQAVAATGGSSLYTWSVIAGSLPAGLTLNSSSGVISGTPTTGGGSTFTIQVTDSNNVTATQQLTLTIIGTLTITSTSPLATGAVGRTYSAALNASGGLPPYTWSISQGSLPSGLSLNSQAGLITGTPRAVGSNTFTIQVNDSGKQVASMVYTISVNTALVITTASLPGDTVSVSYSQTLAATGGAPPLNWSIIEGVLPTGLALNSATGQISGTPNASGSFNFTVQVADANGFKAVAPFIIQISAAPMITTTTLPNATVGVSYPLPLSLTGGTAPFVWTITAGALPAGLTLNSSTGQISGSPTGSGTSTFTVQLTDSAGVSTSRQFTLTVNPPLTISSTSPLATGTVNFSYTSRASAGGTTLMATGGNPPYAWSITSGALPLGLILNAATGQISGTPTMAGQFGFTAQVTDATGVAVAAPFIITINPAVTVPPATLPPPVLGNSYSQQLTATGPGGPFTFSLSAGTLPPGLSLSSAGAITGTPTEAGLFTFSVLVTDAMGNTGTQTYTLTIAPLPAAITIQGLPAMSTGQQQLPVTVALQSAYPLPLTGVLTLQFTPAQGEPDDATVQFNTGGRTVTFTIPAQQTMAVFPVSQLEVQTGTVSGSLSFSVTLSANGVPVSISNNPGVTVSLPAQVPVITNVAIETSGTGFNVVVSGFANDREITGANFSFTGTGGSQITVTQPSGVGAAFQSYFSSAQSAPFGSMFVYTQPFNITSGVMSTLQSVSVTLTNNQGTSTAVSANF